MTKVAKVIVSGHDHEHGTLRSYSMGFIISLVFTITAYLLVVSHNSLHQTTIVILITSFALLQFLAQLIFFLNLGKETKPRWKLFILLFVIGVILILVFGTIWIMDNLNYRMTTPQQINTYMNNQGGGF